MTSQQRRARRPIDQLRASPLAPHLDAFERYLDDRGYAGTTSRTYILCLAHVARWMNQSQLVIEHLDEGSVAQFLDGHLPRCQCRDPVVRRYGDLRAALGHLLVVLRAEAVIPERVPETTPVAEELRHYDAHLNHARGLAPRTRKNRARTVARFLSDRFGNGRIDLSTITPEEMREFVVRQSRHYNTRSSVAALISTLRGYLRFRTACGDHVEPLIGALIAPPIWPQATLPKALSRTEIHRLVDSLGGTQPGAGRDDAIVRCALDLGLRCGEIAKLSLDDIDWCAGTITLRRTKGGREDRLPLPRTTGEAIADYLRFERPPNPSRAVFVRRLAPNDRPLGPDCVRKSIRQAYGRAGLPYTGAHPLRHTMAGRLLESGSSLKEVADVLRHRSLNTTLIYAKLDVGSLSGVALPWPGEVS
jgi:site-specific recombinase XerD